MSNDKSKKVENDEQDEHGTYDEYGLEQPKNIEGEEGYESSIISSNDFQYNIDSYTNAIPVERLVEDFNKGIIKIPNFQRPYVWNKKTSVTNRHKPSLFIDSLLLGLPTPPITIYKEPKARDEGYLIDGLQRLRTLSFFVKGKFDNDKEFKLHGDGIRSDWEGKKYNNTEHFDISEDLLSEEHCTRLMRAFIPVMYVRQIEKDLDEAPGASSIYLLFDRYNSGGFPLHPHEKRSVLGIYNKNLVDLFMLVYGLDGWKDIYPKNLIDFVKHPSYKTRVNEYIFRSYAFTLYGEEYDGNVAKFLDKFMANYKIEKDEIDNMVTITEKIFNIIREHKKKYPKVKLFQPNKSFNIMLFDSIFVALFTALNRGKSVTVEKFHNKYSIYVEKGSYLPKDRESTSSTAMVNRRISSAKELFNV